MPIFEYRCKSCGARVAVLVGMTSDQNGAQCDKCGSAQLEKLVSRFRKGRSEDDRLDEAADVLERHGEPETTAEMRSLVKNIGKAMDEDLSEEMEEMFESDIEGEGSDET